MLLRGQLENMLLKLNNKASNFINEESDLTIDKTVKQNSYTFAMKYTFF